MSRSITHPATHLVCFMEDHASRQIPKESHHSVIDQVTSAWRMLVLYKKKKYSICIRSHEMDHTRDRQIQVDEVDGLRACNSTWVEHLVIHIPYPCWEGFPP